MIKIFGKIRYHWQPELPQYIIYWALTFSLIWLSLTLVYERTQHPLVAIFLAFLSLFFILLGFHRYFIIDCDDVVIVSANLFLKLRIPISEIEYVRVTRTNLQLQLKNKKSHTFQMRKWPRIYFLEMLVLQPQFTGTVLRKEDAE